MEAEALKSLCVLTLVQWQARDATLAQTHRVLVELLAKKEPEEPINTLHQELKFFLQDLLDLEGAEWGAYQRRKLLPHQKRTIEIQFKKRLYQSQPFNKILKKSAFLEDTFELNRHTLAPRPETEGLVLLGDDYLKAFPNGLALRGLDLGAGTGCIALSIAKLEKRISMIAIDRSKEALRVARRNCRKLGLERRVRFLWGDWFRPLPKRCNSQKFHCILSNPPYIPTQEMDRLPPQVARYDPPEALEGGRDGLRDYRQLAFLCQKMLHPQGVLLMEIHPPKGPNLLDLFAPHFHTLKLEKDLCGRDRYLVARSPQV